MTELVFLPDVTPAANAPDISIPSPEEIAFFNLPSLRAFWRAAPGYAEPGAWVDDRNGVRAKLRRSIWPEPAADENGNFFIPQVSEEQTSVWVTDEVSPVIPINGSFTLMFVAEVKEGARLSDQAVMGNAIADLSTASFLGYTASGATLRFRSRGSDHVSFPIGATAQQKHAVVFSYDHSTGQSRLFVNKEQVASGATKTTLLGSNLSICGLMEPSGQAITGSSFKGKLYEADLLNVAIHNSPSALAALNNYLSTYYGL